MTLKERIHFLVEAGRTTSRGKQERQARGYEIELLDWLAGRLRAAGVVDSNTHRVLSSNGPTACVLGKDAGAFEVEVRIRKKDQRELVMV